MKKRLSVIEFIIALITGVAFILFVLSVVEYFNVAIFKNIENYPFGGEGPVAGVKYYESAELYSSAMLQIGGLHFISFILILMWFLKKKIWLLISGIIFFILSFCSSRI